MRWDLCQTYMVWIDLTPLVSHAYLCHYLKRFVWKHRLCISSLYKYIIKKWLQAKIYFFWHTQSVISGYLNQLTCFFFSILRLNFWFHHRFQLNINKTFIFNNFSLKRWSTQIQFRWFCFRILIDFVHAILGNEKSNRIDLKSRSFWYSFGVVECKCFIVHVGVGVSVYLFVNLQFFFCTCL